MIDVRSKSAPSKSALAGRNIVVTRPAGQAHRLADLIRAAGGRAILFPALEIRDVADTRPLERLVARLEEFDLVIFVSANAVNRAMSLIAARRALPAKLKFATVGAGGLRELQRFGVKEAICPASRFDSEALLELPQLQDVNGKRVVIFRGQGGRELLADTLTERGAKVECAECYRRAKPAADAAAWLELWQKHAPDAVTVTSSEGLRNLFEMAGQKGRNMLIKSNLFVPHPRIAEAARALGLNNVIVTAAGDEGLVQGLIEWFDAETQQSS